MKHHFFAAASSVFCCYCSHLLDSASNMLFICLFFLVRRVSKLHLQSSNTCSMLILFDLGKHNECRSLPAVFFSARECGR